MVGERYAGPLPPARCYQGRLFTERAELAQRSRMEREKHDFRQALARLGRKTGRECTPAPAVLRFDLVRPAADAASHAGARVTLTLDGEPVATPPDVYALLGSIVQDLGEIPPDYLVATGDGAYRREANDKRPEDVWKGTYHEEGAFLYNEWDHKRAHYRKH